MYINKSQKYDKLIRDKIPEIIESKGNKAVIEISDNEKLKEYLNNKLVEELEEYQESGSVEELADIVEVIYAILDYNNISIEQFERLRNVKSSERGAFKKGLILKEVIVYNED
ncbi:MAG TPA: nucleoside triphosphate pyrophosphohydrolase [Clostridia bacterium]|nr:nucleoside triphosphate pyrophosphohydrolase [Clostridia bacterium]